MLSKFDFTFYPRHRFAKVHKHHIMDIPRGVEFTTAAAIPEAWITAYQLLFKVAKIKEDETALIMAGASGVGTVLIQLCRYAGASSIAVCSSHEKIERCKALGAFDGINHKQTPNY